MAIVRGRVVERAKSHHINNNKDSRRARWAATTTGQTYLRYLHQHYLIIKKRKRKRVKGELIEKKGTRGVRSVVYSMRARGQGQLREN